MLLQACVHFCMCDSSSEYSQDLNIIGFLLGLILLCVCLTIYYKSFGLSVIFLSTKNIHIKPPGADDFSMVDIIPN